MKPIIRWVGGKTQVLPHINRLVPASFERYVEPFAGGLALFLSLQPEKALINDLNGELINFYECVRSRPDEVADICNTFRNDKETYNNVRAWDRDEGFQRRSGIVRAARFLYLNKTSFQGLWRVNAKGQFNTPFRNPKRYHVSNAELNLFASHAAGAAFTCMDYRDVLALTTDTDFVYLDPPYHPVTQSGSFNGYTSLKFSPVEHLNLRDACDELDAKGVRFLLSNSDCDVVRDMFSKYDIVTVPVKRLVAARGHDRKNTTELLIRNY